MNRIAQLFISIYFFRLPKIFGKLNLKFYEIIYKNFSVGKNPQIWGKFFVTIFEPSLGSIKIGNNFRLISSNRRSLIANFFHTKLTIIGSGKINIGDNVSFNGVAITSMNKISIGNEAMLAPNVVITDTDFHKSSVINDRQELCDPDIKHSIEIGKNVWIGASTIILKGVSIGENSIVSAGSVVSKDIPANVIAAGNPACTVSNLNQGYD